MPTTQTADAEQSTTPWWGVVTTIDGYNPANGRPHFWRTLHDSISVAISTLGKLSIDSEFSQRLDSIYSFSERKPDSDFNWNEHATITDVYPEKIVKDCFNAFKYLGAREHFAGPFDQVGLEPVGRFAAKIIKHDIDVRIVFDVLDKAFCKNGLTGKANPFARFKAAIAAWDNYENDAGSTDSWEAFCTQQANKLNADAEPATSIDS